MHDEEAFRKRVDEARAERDTVGRRDRGARDRCAARARLVRGAEDRLDGRLAAALMSIQAVKGVEIGDGFALAGLRGSQAHDEIHPGFVRETNHAGGIEPHLQRREDVVVRAAMKPLPTLMKPLQSVDLETGEPGEALVERSDVAAVEALAVVAEAAVAFELARAAVREVRRRRALGDFVASWRAYLERIPWQPRADRHLVLVGFMGAGKTTIGAEVAHRLGREFVDVDRDIESNEGKSIASSGATAARTGSANRRPSGSRSASTRATSP